MRRLFWLGLGAVLGAWTVLRFKRLVRAWMPQSIANQAAGLSATLRDFAGDVRAGMHDRESELREALGLTEEALMNVNNKKDGH